jgi:multiple sugar transport system permease protein
MQSVPDELYEATRLDTSSAWMMFRKITFPLIAPALGTVTMLRLVETFKILDIPFTLTGGTRRFDPDLLVLSISKDCRFRYGLCVGLACCWYWSP